MAVGEGFGVGDVEHGAGDHALAQCCHEVVGDDVTTAADIAEPRIAAHRRERLGIDDVAGLIGEGEGDDDGVGVGDGLVEAVGGERASSAGDGVVASSDDGDVAAPWLDEFHEGFGDPAASEDGEFRSEEVLAVLHRPRRRPHIAGDVAKCRQQGRHDPFGHGRGIDPLPAGPCVVVVEVMLEGFDPRIGKLDPLDTGTGPDDVRERVGGGGIGEHKRAGLLDRNDGAACSLDGLDHDGVHRRTGAGFDGDQVTFRHGRGRYREERRPATHASPDHPRQTQAAARKMATCTTRNTTATTSSATVSIGATSPRSTLPPPATSRIPRSARPASRPAGQSTPY